MNTGGHILTEFDEALQSLKSKTNTIGKLAQHNLELALTGLFQRKPELCNTAIAEDEEVDNLEIEIDEAGVTLMSKYRPFATDLRMILASMKITNVVERIADHAVSIAKRSRKLLRNPELAETVLIEPLYQLANQMVCDALIAYNDGNQELALQVIENDKQLNELHNNATKRLTKCLESGASGHKDYINLVFIARWLERVGDLACNIAEDVIFMETAADIRHGGELPE